MAAQPCGYHDGSRCFAGSVSQHDMDQLEPWRELAGGWYPQTGALNDCVYL